MFRRFINSVYGSTPAQFISDYSLEESGVRLSDALKKPSIFSGGPHGALVGRVTNSDVWFARVIHLQMNCCKPVFYGSFSSDGHRVILSGHFTMHGFIKVFMTAWFGFALLWIVLAVDAFSSGQPGEGFHHLASGIVVFLLGVAGVKLGQWVSRNDIEWVSKIVEDTLSRRGA